MIEALLGESHLRHEGVFTSLARKSVQSLI